MVIGGGIVATGVLGFIIGVLFGSVVVHFAAKLSGVHDATFGKAFKACLTATLLTFVLNIALGFLPGIGTLIAVILSLVITLLIFKSVYNTGWGRAFVIWLLQWAVLFIIALVVTSLAGISMMTL